MNIVQLMVNAGSHRFIADGIPSGHFMNTVYYISDKTANSAAGLGK
jgi:hypothetical protein